MMDPQASGTSPLKSISPVDGRYESVTRRLQAYFSEEALIRYRVRVEVDYFLALARIPLPPLKGLSPEEIAMISSIAVDFSERDALRVKEIEQTSRHDIKAVEYFIRERFHHLGLGKHGEMIHFGLTSQDINNTAIPLSLKEAMEEVMVPAFGDLLNLLGQMSDQWIDVPMLARTHGQPASPTTLGKEILVFHERITRQLDLLRQLPYPAKFGGATGNFNAHHLAYPQIDWVAFARRFCASMGLERSQTTTQIDHYDGLAAIFDALKRLSTILIDLSRDFWTYVSLDYFKQKVVAGEVGSSAMPHKVNPIDFENAEGNAGVAIALFEHLSAKLPISRLQRDLSDSTVLRNLGVPMAHLLIALRSAARGLQKVSLNAGTIEDDLERHWVVVAEGIQSILRSISYPSSYEVLKELTRTGGHISRDRIHAFIDGLDVDEDTRRRMKQITPFNYTGIMPKQKKT